MGRRRWIAGGLSLLSLLTACGSSQGSSDASCVGPYVDDQSPTGTYGAPPPTVSSGGKLRLYGHWYTSTCNDTGGNASLKPLPPVRLTINLPGGSVMHVGPLTPGGKDMGFSTTVQLPAQTPAGTATVNDNLADATTYKFTISSA